MSQKLTHQPREDFKAFGRESGSGASDPCGFRPAHYLPAPNGSTDGSLHSANGKHGTTDGPHLPYSQSHGSHHIQNSSPNSPHCQHPTDASGPVCRVQTQNYPTTNPKVVPLLQALGISGRSYSPGHPKWTHTCMWS